MSNKICFNGGLVSDVFLTNNAKIHEINDAFILIADSEISDIFKLKPIFESSRYAKKNLVIIAKDFYWKTVSDIVKFQKIYSMDCVCIRFPQSETNYKDFLQDIAILTGGVVIDDLKKTEKLLSSQADQVLGKADKVKYSPELTEIYSNAGNPISIQNRIKEIEKLIEDSTSESTRKKLSYRLEKLFEHTYIKKSDEVISNKISNNNANDNSNFKTGKAESSVTDRKIVRTSSTDVNIITNTSQVTKTRPQPEEKKRINTKKTTINNRTSDSKTSEKSNANLSTRLTFGALGLIFGLIIAGVFSYLVPDLSIFNLSEILADSGELDFVGAICLNCIPPLAGLISGLTTRLWADWWLTFVVSIVAFIAIFIIFLIIAFVIAIFENLFATIVVLALFSGLIGGGGYVLFIFVRD